MRRCRGGIGGDFLPHPLHDPDHFLPIRGVHQRIVGLRTQPHAVHDEEPAQLDEHLVALVEDAAGALIHLDPLGQGVRQLDLFSLLPVRRVRRSLVQ